MPELLTRLTRLVWRRYGPLLAVLVVLAALVAVGPASGRGIDTIAGGSGAPVAAGAPSTGVGNATTPDGVGATSASDGAASEIETGAGGPTPSGGTNSGAWGPGQWPAPGADTQCRADGMMPDYLVDAPMCLPVFAGDNGGATAQGVTADEVKVVVYYPPIDPATEVVLSTYGIGADQDGIKYQAELFRRYLNNHRETYGREVTYVNFDGSGTDPQSQRADAIEIANEVKPFAVVYEGQSTTGMVEELSARGIPCFCVDSQGRSYHVRFPGMSFSSLPTADQYYENVVDYMVKKGLARGPAEFAGPPPVGEPTYNDQRRFGLVYTQTAAGSGTTPEPSYEQAAATFAEAMASNGIPLAAKIAYRSDLPSMQQQSTNIIAQLRTADVNNIILFVDPIMPVSLTKEATRQGYFPEWFVTGTFVSDFSFFGRTYDQQQWAHAFGISPFPLLQDDPYIGPGYASYLHAGGDPDREFTFYGPGVKVSTLFDGIHLAGPNLTPATMAEGLFRSPVRIRGNPFFGDLPWAPRILFTPQDPVTFSDFAEIWWDTDRAGRDEFHRNGIGQYVRANGAKRYGAGDWPSEPPFVFDRDPHSVVWADELMDRPLIFDHGEDGHTHDYDSERCRSC